MRPIRILTVAREVLCTPSIPGSPTPRRTVMKTLMTSATLLPLLIACGGPTQTHADAEAPIECVYSVRGTDAALVSRALNAVLQNQVDPCAGAVDMVSRNIQLERIDQSVDAAAQRVFL